MDDNTTQEAEGPQTYWSRHRYLLLVTFAIAISLVLVSISMTLYNSTGAQVDLSRPGYSAVTDQAVKNDGGFENYSAFGSLSQDSIDEFKTLYDTQASKAKAVDAFSGDPLNPDVLEIGAVSTAEQ